MAASIESRRAERIAAVVAQAAAHPAPAAALPLEGFAREYFRQVDVDDLDERTPGDLLGALLSHWQFASQRGPGVPKVRVLSPTQGADGWNSRHSIVQVVNDDMPFLVDSVSLEIARHGLSLHLVVHPVFAVERDAAGVLRRALPRHEAPQALQRESWMYIEVDRIADTQQRAQLCRGIERVLADVRAAVRDWKPMLARLEQVAQAFAPPPAGIAVEEAHESRAFLEWLADDHFTLLGYRQHDLVEQGGELALRPVPGTGLGLLHDGEQAATSASFAALPAAARALARTPSPQLVVTKANTRSTVHRDGYTDLVGVKRFDAGGRVVGEHRFIGLFTSTAYMARVSETPLLRRKVEAVAARAGFAPGGHLSKALQHTLETFPRDDLFQIAPDELFETAMGILALGERNRLRLFTWKDPFDRFVSFLVFVPRENFSTQLRLKFQQLLLQALGGSHIDFDVVLSGQQLARIHFTVRIAPQPLPEFDRKDLERRLAGVARRWEDDLREALVEAQGEGAGLALEKRWAAAMPASYRERVPARDAVHDVRKLEGLSEQAPLALSLYAPPGAPEGRLGLKVYRLGAPVVLSDSLPMLEHMGARVLAEDNHRLDRGGAPSVYLHDFALQAQPGAELDPQALARLFEDAFARVFRGEVESDDFNRLVLRAGLAADEVVVLRAYAKYLQQIGFAASQATISATLAAHPRIARMLVALFRLRFDPQGRDSEGAAAQVNALNQALEKVANLSEDRVLRQLMALVQATLRTNFWRTGVGASGAPGPRRPFLSLKLDSAKVPGLPRPVPLYEIWVYSPRFEGIHLRGGKVARGGLRWSDRPDDFRTEVLGLVKAQMVKNTVIVPVGSKGGFVLKKAPPASQREAFLQEGIACYQDYLRGLLDLTDNLVAGQVVPPPQVVRVDGDDPYLVVAADKGTASFSDHANAVSAEYGHWLGDAFASGGSQGYDHKAMGITARGAWESAKRHFRELGVDIQSTDFTVAGIGDMSGDVFGNGMLLSRHIRLVAAFDHRHVFIDPDPDAARSFAERERLFRLPRSSWADYDRELISAGGGIWARSEKSIPLSPQARAVLGVEAEQLTPAELVSAILMAPVDLLYNGGIGTYVKHSAEAHGEVGDRANDAVRVDGADLRCKVVVEGGNLGFTQRGRIEAALAGVRLNTDAIDNSAGVDTSDHEVNIKILLGIAEADGSLATAQRNALLPQMTDEVAALVLRDNYFQTQALSIGKRVAPQQLEEQARFIRFLEKKGALDRAIEFLPAEEEIAERKARGLGLTSPEQAVLLAYGKMWLNDALVASDVPEDAWIATALERYFPRQLRENFAGAIPRHPLRREIIVTHVLNSMVNRVGPTFVHRLGEITGATPPQVVRAYLAAREVFGLVALWEAIEALDNRVPDETQADMVLALRALLGRATAWFLRSRRSFEATQQQVGRFAPAVRALRAHGGQGATGSPRVRRWTAAGVPAGLAAAVDSADALFHALDVAEIAEAVQRPLELTAQVHAGVGERLGLPRMRQQIEVLPAESFWQGLAKLALADDLADLQRSIAQEALGHADAASVTQVLDRWEAGNRQALLRARRLLAELEEAPGGELAMLSVALRELRNLV